MRALAIAALAIALAACGSGTRASPAPVDNTGGSSVVLSPPGADLEIEPRCSDWRPGVPTAVYREPADAWTSVLATCRWATECHDACCPVSCDAGPAPTEACDEGGVLTRLVLLDEDTCRG